MRKHLKLFQRQVAVDVKIPTNAMLANVGIELLPGATGRFREIFFTYIFACGAILAN